jgi:ribosomal protein L11 methyltransferase
VDVVLDAADAFGSGSHPTTRLCLAQVERLARPGDRVLAVGPGTGVLGVAALLLGAGHLPALDVDPAAVRATAGTARLNGVADRAQASATPLAQVSDRFELVVANLLIPAIEQLGTDLARVVEPGGHLVVSGVLAGQVHRVSAAVGAAPASVTGEDGWAALVFAPG